MCIKSLSKKFSLNTIEIIIRERDSNVAPLEVSDLLNHQCIVIKELDYPFGLWELDNIGGKQRNIKVSGHLASNNGEMVRLWALEEHGIMLRLS